MAAVGGVEAKNKIQHEEELRMETKVKQLCLAFFFFTPCVVAVQLSASRSPALGGEEGGGDSKGY